MLGHYIFKYFFCPIFSLFWNTDFGSLIVTLPTAVRCFPHLLFPLFCQFVFQFGKYLLIELSLSLLFISFTIYSLIISYRRNSLSFFFFNFSISIWLYLYLSPGIIPPFVHICCPPFLLDPFPQNNYNYFKASDSPNFRAILESGSVNCFISWW